MNLLKKIVVVSMASIMASSALSGCGGGGTSSSGSSSTASGGSSSTPTSSTSGSSTSSGGTAAAGDGKVDYSDPTQISKEVIKPSFMLTSADYSGKGDELIWQTIKKLTNIEFQVIPVPLASWKEKEATALASGDLPDIMGCRTYTTVDKYGPQGAFLELDPYIEKGMMPNFVEVIDSKPPAAILAKSPNGKHYGAPRIYATPRMDQALLVRLDILEKLNLNREPETFDDLYNILKAMKDAYPNSTPYFNRWETTHLLSGMGSFFDTSYTYYLAPDATSYVYGPASQNYKDTLAFLAKLYKDGLLDKDFATLQDKEYEEKLITSKAFMTFDYQDTGFYESSKDLMDEGWNWGAMLPPKYNDKRAGYPVLEGYYGYTKAIANTTKYKEELVRFFDWTYAEAGQQALMFGIEGTDYEKNADGSVKMITDIKYAGNPTGTVLVHGLNDQNIFSVLPGNAAEFYENVGEFTIAQKKYLNEKKAFANPVFGARFYDSAKEKQYTDIRVALETYITEESTKVIQGQSSVDNWDAVLKVAQDTYLYETGLEMINAAYKETYGK